MVKAFGLCNAPSSFMRLMNEILRPFLNKFIVVYIDNILDYCTSIEAHLSHFKSSFEKLREQKLYGKMEKCDFLVPSIAFLCNIVSRYGVHVDLEKTKAISSWLAPTSAHECQSFYGITSFYRRFIHNFSTIMSPIVELMKKKEFSWKTHAQRAFE